MLTKNYVILVKINYLRLKLARKEEVDMTTLSRSRTMLLY